MHSSCMFRHVQHVHVHATDVRKYMYMYIYLHVHILLGCAVSFVNGVCMLHVGN